VGDGTGAGLGEGDGDWACAGDDAQGTHKGANMRTAASAIAAAIPLLLHESRDAQPINAVPKKLKRSAAPLKNHPIV
jgi:hypothetical protein